LGEQGELTLFSFCSSFFLCPNLLFDIRHALRSFKHAPPPKSHKAAMSQWNDWLVEHVFEQLQRCWQF
jgi:hypothetical protein